MIAARLKPSCYEMPWRDVAHLLTIARLELQAATRLKWIRLLTVAFALLATAAAYAAGAAGELSGADGFERTTMTLVPVVLILVPLAALVLGITGQSAEAGGEPFLFAQPIRRSTVLLGRWIGEASALAGAIAAGFAAGGVLVAFSSGIDGLLRFAFFVVAAIVLGTIFLSIAAAIASATDKRVTALGIGTFVWFFFVLLYDAGALSLAGWITGSAGGRVLFGSVFLNPADLIRIAMLSVSGTPNVLGAAGDAWIRFLGGTAQASALSIAVLAAWTTAPLAIGVQLLRSRDL
jgi:Cu-processing system permease protein